MKFISQSNDCNSFPKTKHIDLIMIEHPSKAGMFLLRIKIEAVGATGFWKELSIGDKKEPHGSKNEVQEELKRVIKFFSGRPGYTPVDFGAKQMAYFVGWKVDRIKQPKE